MGESIENLLVDEKLSRLPLGLSLERDIVRDLGGLPLSLSFHSGSSGWMYQQRALVLLQPPFIGRPSESNN